MLRVGTRGSALALAQSSQVALAIAAAAGWDADAVQLVRIQTEGDVNSGPLAQIGGTGVFVTAVRQALLHRDVDLIVHSFKDLPTAPADGIALGCVPVRESPADALCSKGFASLADLPQGASVGTGSPRRRAQLLAARPDLEVTPLRGNVDTRLAATLSGRLDAVLLAAAGLHRLGRREAISELLDPEVFLPAPAQGALAVEVRADEELPFAAGLHAVDNPLTRRCALAEREVLRRLEAGCSAPVAAYASMTGDELVIRAQVTAPDGRKFLRRSHHGPAGSDQQAVAVGREIAESLLALGAAKLMADQR